MFHRQIGRLGAFEYSIDKVRLAIRAIKNTCTIGDEAALFGELRLLRDGREFEI